MQIDDIVQRLLPEQDYSGSIIAGGTPQLLVPKNDKRSYFLLQNTSSGILSYGLGPATARASVSGGVVSAIAVRNGGINYSVAPSVLLIGGSTGPGLGYPSPVNTAKAHSVLTGGVVSSIVLDNPGSGYNYAPDVYLMPDPTDPLGAFAPSATQGFQLNAGGSYVMETTTILNGRIYIWGATTGQTFACEVS